VIDAYLKLADAIETDTLKILTLEKIEETFDGRIIVTVALTGHALNNV
jgi:hypothetical protein